MSKTAVVNYIVNEDSIELPGGERLTMPGKIVQVADFGEAFVVLIDWMATNRNVFGVNQTGEQIWQIEEQPAVNNGNPCTRLERRGSHAFVGTWDGLELLIEPFTGQIIKERRERGITTEWVTRLN